MNSWREKLHLYLQPISLKEGFPGGSEVKNPPANAGDAGSIPGSGRCPGEGNGHPFQYPFLGHPLDRGAWWTTVLGVAKSQTQLTLSLESTRKWIKYVDSRPSHSSWGNVELSRTLLILLAMMLWQGSYQIQNIWTLSYSCCWAIFNTSSVHPLHLRTTLSSCPRILISGTESQ